MTGSCNENTGVQEGVQGECPTIDIGCVPETSGQPTYTPNPDQLPLAIDKDTNILWLYSCENGWCSIDVSLCRLNPVDISVLNNLCQILKIPVTYNVGGECVEGTITLNELAVEVYKCLDLPPYPCVTVAPTDAGHTKVTPVTDPVTGKIDYQVENDLLATCEKDDIPQQDIDAATAIKLDACITNPDGSTTGGLIPLPEDKGPLTCIPIVSEQDPDGPGPAEGESPVRLDCGGALWLWKCDGTGWHRLEFTLPEFEALDPADVDNICENLKFHVWYDDPDCIKQREMTLQQLVEELQKCLCASIATDNTTNAMYALDCVNGVIIRRPIPPICDQLKDLTPVAVPVNGSDVQLVYVDAQGNCFRGPIEGCCPVIFGSAQGNSGGTCFDVPSGSLLFDSRVDGFHPTPTGPPRPLNFTVTNPTNNVGVVHLQAQGYVARYTPTVRKDAQLFTGLGLKSTTDMVGGVGSGSEPQPHAVTGGMTYEVQDIPTTDQYPWFENFGGHAAFGNGNVRQYTASSLYKDFSIQPGQTLTFAVFFAIGYDGPTSGIESFHGGAAASVHFVGYND